MMFTIVTLQVTSRMDPNYQPTSLYNNHHTVNAPGYRPQSTVPNPTAFNTPPLPPGSTILVDEEDDDEDRDMDDSPSSPVIESTTADYVTTASLPGNDMPSTQGSPGSANAAVQSHSGPTAKSLNDSKEDDEEEEE